MIGAKYKLFSAKPKASMFPGTRIEKVAKLCISIWRRHAMSLGWSAIREGD